MLFTGKYRCKNTMFVEGNRGGRGYTLLAEESICFIFKSETVVWNDPLGKGKLMGAHLCVNFDFPS